MTHRLQILVVEDDTIVALELRRYLVDLDCDVIGPFATIADTEASLERTLPDHAFLDVNLRDGLAFPLADTLGELGVPFTFITSFEGAVRKNGYTQPVIQKPYKDNVIKYRIAEILKPNEIER